MAQLSFYEKQTVVNNRIPKESCKSIHPFKSYAKKGTQKESKFFNKITAMSARIMTGKRGLIQNERKSSSLSLKRFALQPVAHARLNEKMVTQAASLITHPE